MKLFFGKGQMVEDHILKYLELMNDTKLAFIKTMNIYFKQNKPQKLSAECEAIHRHESQADDLRRSIETELYAKALLPEFRADILRLLERMDKIPNTCESVVYMIDLQNIKLPKILISPIKELISVNVEAIDEVNELIHSLLKDPEKVKLYVGKIDKIESASDHRERRLIQQIFLSKSIKPFDKLLLRDLILEIGNISNHSESLSDLVTIINIKVKV